MTGPASVFDCNPICRSYPPVVKLIVAHLDYVLPFEHVPQLVLVLMDVERRVEWVDLLDDGKQAASRVGGGLDDELCTAESEALTAVSVDLETRACSIEQLYLNHQPARPSRNLGGCGHAAGSTKPSVVVVVVVATCEPPAKRLEASSGRGRTRATQSDQANPTSMSTNICMNSDTVPLLSPVRSLRRKPLDQR